MVLRANSLGGKGIISYERGDAQDYQGYVAMCRLAETGIGLPYPAITWFGVEHRLTAFMGIPRAYVLRIVGSIRRRRGWIEEIIRGPRVMLLLKLPQELAQEALRHLGAPELPLPKVIASLPPQPPPQPPPPRQSESLTRVVVRLAPQLPRASRRTMLQTLPSPPILYGARDEILYVSGAQSVLARALEIACGGLPLHGAMAFDTTQPLDLNAFLTNETLTREERDHVLREFVQLGVLELFEDQSASYYRLRLDPHRMLFRDIPRKKRWHPNPLLTQVVQEVLSGFEPVRGQSCYALLRCFIRTRHPELHERRIKSLIYPSLVGFRSNASPTNGSGVVIPDSRSRVWVCRPGFEPFFLLA